MSADQTIDYEGLALDAMRGLVRTILRRVHKHGLPGNHHFYIEFYTQAPGVSVSSRLKQKYPEKMTIVMQHRFWGLQVYDDKFEIKLTFDSIPECLVVPYSAIKVFFDPSVPYGFQFEEGDAKGDTAGSASDQIERATGVSDLSLVPDVSPVPSDAQRPPPLSPVEHPGSPFITKAPPLPKRPRRKRRVKSDIEQELGVADQSAPPPVQQGAGQPSGTAGSTDVDITVGAPIPADEDTPLAAQGPDGQNSNDQNGGGENAKDDETKLVPQMLSQSGADNRDKSSDAADDNDVAGEDQELADISAKVVSLDAFRKK